MPHYYKPEASTGFNLIIGRYAVAASDEMAYDMCRMLLF